jgi:hypothetical protein
VQSLICNKKVQCLYLINGSLVFGLLVSGPAAALAAAGKLRKQKCPPNLVPFFQSFTNIFSTPQHVTSCLLEEDGRIPKVGHEDVRCVLHFFLQIPESCCSIDARDPVLAMLPIYLSSFDLREIGWTTPCPFFYLVHKFIQLAC